MDRETKKNRSLEGIYVDNRIDFAALYMIYFPVRINNGQRAVRDILMLTTESYRKIHHFSKPNTAKCAG